MNKVLIAAAAAALSLSAVSAAYAQPPGGWVRHDEWKKGYHMRHDDWARGQQVDWHAHHLRRPPHGYEWRQVDGNYVLAAVATGVIASIIANSH
ncbi:RcnB family protein [Phenylobacterium sp.]|jgi:Ni/Co efflux regulator RcnB|uniref:RcnB family protein n=1 Tax=Phenylobacterium sp. TaxID=1871053 RepID=UPI002F41E69E